MVEHLWQKLLEDPTQWWNNIPITAQHVKCEQGRKFLTLHEEMRERRAKFASHPFVAALKQCRSLQDLESAKQIHAEAIGSGLELDGLMGSTLVDVYAKCGSLADARRIFEKMHRRNVVTWSAMILGYAQMEEGEVALGLYARMQQEGVLPNNRTFVGALKACSSLVAREGGSGADRKDVKSSRLEQVRTIHSDIWKRGFESDVFVGTMLVNVYVKCGSIVDARLVFDTLPQHDVVSWTAMILGYAQMDDGEEAWQMYECMQEEGVLPDNRTFIGALKSLSSLAALEDGCKVNGMLVKKQCLDHVRAIHSQIVGHGFVSDVYLETMLVDAYVKCGSLVDACRVFEEMPRHDVVSWTALILGYVQMEDCKVALELYTRMQQEGQIPNDRTFVGILKACSLTVLNKRNQGEGTLEREWCLHRVRAIHSYIVQVGFLSDVYVGSMLVDVYAKCRNLVDARLVFEKMPHRNVVSWNAIILGYVEMGESTVALDMYSRMQQEGVLPDDLTFVGALKAWSALGTLEEGRRTDQVVKNQRLDDLRAIHSDIAKNGFEMHILVGTMLVDVYAKCGSLVDARHAFEKMPHRDVVSWTAMIFGYAQIGEGEIALQLFARMQKEGIVPSDRTYVAALKACGTLEKGKKIHAELSDREFEATDIFVANALIDMYCRCGSMVDAQQVFDTRSTRDIVTWNALISGYARQGGSGVVFDLFNRMIQQGIQPDNITFLSVLTICSHVGLVTEGLKYFEAMSRDHGIIPTIDHYTCLVGLLGRAGQIDKALEMVNIMPFQPDGAVWQTVLDACRKWSNVELGRHAFECATGPNKRDTSIE